MSPRQLIFSLPTSNATPDEKANIERATPTTWPSSSLNSTFCYCNVFTPMDRSLKRVIWQGRAVGTR